MSDKIKLTATHKIIVAPFDNTNEYWVLTFNFFRDIFLEKLLFSRYNEIYTPYLLKADATFFFCNGKPAGMNLALFYEDPEDPNNTTTQKTYTARGVQGLYPAFQGRRLSRPMHDKYMSFYREHKDSIIFIKAAIISGIEYRQLARALARIYPSPKLAIPNEVIIELRKFINAHGGEISPLQPFALEPDTPVIIEAALVNRMIELKKRGDIYLNFYCKNTCQPGIVCNSENCCSRNRGLAVVIPLNKHNINSTIIKGLINKITKILPSIKL